MGLLGKKPELPDFYAHLRKIHRSVAARELGISTGYMTGLLSGMYEPGTNLFGKMERLADRIEAEEKSLRCE